MIEGIIEKHQLRFRTELATGKLTLADGTTTRIATSLNIDNKAVFVEFPDLSDDVKVMYKITDLINDAIDVMKKAGLLPKEEEKDAEDNKT
jgi:hypothetical protein